ncbi:unnamed protein product [Rotaria sp. Silwood1]|nr:unnamed protein product [Rotaria sp. Silwood1]
MPTKDGKVKKLDLENGGGSRLCDWFNKDMSLNDIYRLIFNIFKLGNLTKINVDNFISQFLFYGSQADTELETSLYDFQLQPLDVNQYETFLETSVPTRTNSSITSIEYKHVNKEKQDINSEQIDSSLYEYSFINSINSIMKNIDDLMSQNSYDGILIKLFENMCIIHGYSFLTINAIKQQIRRSKKDFQSNKQSDITLYSNCLNNIYISCELTIILLKRQKNRFSHIPLYSMTRESFIEFYHNLKFLNNARDLLNAMNEPRLLTFRNIIQTIVVDIESILSTINMYNSISINNAKEALTSLRMQYSRIFKSDLFTSSIYRITQPTKQVYKKTLAVINDLIEYLTNYQVQTVENQTKNSNLSSTFLSITDQEQLENKESIQRLKRKSETLHADRGVSR